MNFARGVALLLASFGTTGCPAVLDDNFTTVPAGAGAPSSSGGRGGNDGHAGDVAMEGLAGAQETGGSSVDAGGSGNKAGATNTGGSSSEIGGAAGAGELGAGGATDSCPPCGPNEACCDGACVDTRYDANNCRSCGHGCPGTTCDGSSCTNTCAQGYIDCNDNVVDGCEVNPAIDPKNCGNCGIQCGFQLQCVEGYCVCPPGTADCDGRKDNGCETDTSSDKSSCGGCGKVCGANQVCGDGKCSCAVGFLDCDGLAGDGCEATVTASSTCGSCELDCGPNSICVAAGQCGCVPGHLNCDSVAPGCETPASDPTHCGACDVSCPNDQPACDGVSCSTGCGGGLTACGASCVDTNTDSNNCGGCGKQVGLNQVCAGGAPTCAAGYGDCDSNPADCEANTQTDAGHCGTCDIACKSGAECQAGQCACAPSTPNDCGATCEQCCSDAQCSDGDSCTTDTCNGGVCAFTAECASGGVCCAGTGCFECCSNDDCSGGKVCTGNQCVSLTCSAPQIACNSKCVDPTNDANNCGGCGNVCGKGRSCSKSVCTPHWVAAASPPGSFVARDRAAYAAMADKVFVWGGADANNKSLATGAVYDPTADAWTAVPATGTPPSERVLATAVWTGTVMVVWGGGDAAGNADYATGSRFDPANQSWQAMSTSGAPNGRRAPHGFWTGSRVLFYGGLDKSDNPVSGAFLYDPVNDKWSNASTSGQPSARSDSTIGWTGTELLVYGGRTGSGATASTFVYDLASNSWQRQSDGPTQRSGAFGTWDGTYLSAWSGYNTSFRGDGKLYEPVSDKWTNMGNAGQPSLRWASHRYTGWSFNIKPHVTLLLGGYGISFDTDGGIYNSTTNGWTAVASWPSGAAHSYGVCVWNGSEVILWGGGSGLGTLTNAAERYLP